MGITIRELITRFGFEVDEKGAKDIEKRVDGMKKGFSGLGKLLGVTVGIAGAKAMWNLGQSAGRAQWNLQRLAGTDFKPLRRQFKNIQDELDGIKEGASDVIKEKEFDIAAAGFLKVFGRGQGQVKTFGKLFSFAAKQAVITGANVTDIMQQLQSGIQGGGFDALLELPGFDIFKKQLLEFQQAAIDPGDPGGRIALQNRLKAIMNIVAGAAVDQNRAMKDVPDVLLEADKAAAGFQDGLQKIAKTVNTLLVPALKGMNVALNRFNELVEVAREAETPGGAFQNVINEILNPAERPIPVVSIPGPVPQTFPGPTGRELSVTIHNTFAIPAGDAFSVAREVKKAQEKQLKDVMDSHVKTED